MKRHASLWVALLVISAVYFSTLQTIPNGSSDPYMIDVGETQVALNVWGVLHATGYPLYTFLGNLFTPVPQIFGFSPATAASLFSAFWTLLALGGLYWLLWRVTQNAFLSTVAVLLLAMARSIWIHSVVAEVYSMSLAILIGLWIIAFAPQQWRFEQRLLGLALLGGIGIAHHRAVAFAGLGLIFALLPFIRSQQKALPRLILIGAGLFLLGFLQYGYVLLRANAQTEWLYADDLNTWGGFWFFFMGREADYLVTTPDSLTGWLENLTGTLDILLAELTIVGVGLSLLAGIIACGWSKHKRLAWGTALSGLGFFLWAVSYHQAVLPEAIVMMILPTFAVWIALALDWLATKNPQRMWASGLAVVALSMALIPIHRPDILALTEDPTGLESIAAANSIPRDNPLEDPVLMLSWGPRYFAASYSRLVTGENADLAMVDHTADFAALVLGQGKTLYTEPDTLYGYPIDWWQARIGTVYPNSVGGNMLRLATEPRLVEGFDTSQALQYMEAGIWLVGADVTCTSEGYQVALGWYAETMPNRNLSVKMHLVDATSEIPLAQADSAAPVHGWRLTTTWQANELLQDHYTLPRHPQAQRIIVGLYEQLADGSFANYGDTPLPLPRCEP